MKTNKFLKINIIFDAVLILLFCVYNAVLLPLYNRYVSDVLYNESYLPWLLESALELCQFLVWIHIFSFIVYSFFGYDKKSALRVMIHADVIILVRYFLLLAINVTSGNIAVNGSDFSFYVGEMFLYAFLDILQSSLPYLILAFLFRMKISENKKNCLSVGFSAGLITLLKVAMRIINDVFEHITFGYSFSAIYLTYYVADILYGLMIYFLVLILVNLYMKKRTTV